MPKRERATSEDEVTPPLSGDDEPEEPDDLEAEADGSEDEGSDDEGSDDDDEDDDDEEEAEDEPKKKERAKKGEGKHRALYKQFDFPHQQLQFLVERSAFIEFEETDTAYLLKPTEKALLPKYANWFKNKAAVFKLNKFEPQSEGSKIQIRLKSKGLMDPATFLAVGEKPVRAKDSQMFVF